MHNLDVEVAASGFTRDMSKSFDEVRLRICVVTLKLVTGKAEFDRHAAYE